ncbi:MAG: hypothetical protein CRN43_21420 [Candidatus Nephrothrix sp. EaCA]|nr:MAG: hypothetical protein CRN43_21420 [Candidatus Nephrothrix sp. EaCA]
MKKRSVFLATGFIAILLIAVLGFFSCVKKEEAQSPKQPSLSLERIFEKAIEKAGEITNDDEVVEMILEWDSKNQSGIIEKINVRESTIKDDLPNYLENDAVPAARTLGKKTYTVSCSVECKGCSGSASSAYGAAEIAGKCLDEGGCATICRAKLVYYPEDEFFVISREINIDK